MTRRTLLSSAAVATAAWQAKGARNETPAWRPKLGVLGRFTPANVAFAHEQGFSNMILDGGLRPAAGETSVSDSDIEKAKQVLAQNHVGVSAFQMSMNHIDPDPAKRAEINKRFVAGIELAGKMGVPFIGTTSGKDAGKHFPDQVDEIVRVYTEKYFRACEENKVRILWEPWPNGPNIATGPVGFSALFRAFDNSPHVGLQFDPSHLQWQFMDPVETAREFIDKIYDVHLKDTEIIWSTLRAGGINPVNGARWWRYRIPGAGSVNWRDFFNVLENVGYSGAMSIEQEDELYGAGNNPGPDFGEDFKLGFIMAKRYLNQYVP